MKVYILYTYNDKEWDSILCSEYLNKLPAKDAERSLKFKRWQDRQAHILGRLLLREGLSFLGFKNDIAEIQFHKLGKPYFKEGPFFNITHSGNYVLCAISEVELGIDVEEMKDVDIQTFGSIFSEAEINAIDVVSNAVEKQKLFYEIWTKKEAIVKALGEGITMKLKEINTFQIPCFAKGKYYYLHLVQLDTDYISHVSVEGTKEIKMNLQRIDFHI